MAQITIYLDNNTIKKIEKAAADNHLSISRWVREKLERSLCNEWPESYFSFFGILNDEDLKEPPELDFYKDIKREIL